MRIQELQQEISGAFLQYYRSSFANRNDILARVNHELRNPWFRGAGVPLGLLAFDNETIVGQLLLQSCAYVSDGQITPCYVGYDLFVTERYRRAGVGGLLMFDAIRRLRPYFAIGPSHMVTRMLNALNISVIGELHKYLWLRKSLSAAISAIRGIGGFTASWRERPLPAALPVSPGENIRQNLMPQLDGNTDVNDGVLSFTRTREFIHWRFIDHPNRYSVFTFEFMPSAFFVVRLCVWRGLRVLTLVDYRCPPSRPDLLKRMVDSTKGLARAVGADGVLSMSSHSQVDQVFRESGFLKVGKPNLIMADLPSTPNPELIGARRTVLITMADGDTDLLFQAAGS